MPKKKRAEGETHTSRRTNSLCQDCPAKCCHDLVLCIEKPKDASDIDHYKWQLQYDVVSLAVHRSRWYAVYHGRCIYLDDEDMCTIYDQRPDKCRRHNPPECEHYGSWYDVIIKTPGEFDRHLEQEKERKRRRRAQARARKKKAGKAAGRKR